jgi:hypothetical protein
VSLETSFVVYRKEMRKAVDGHRIYDLRGDVSE